MLTPTHLSCSADDSLGFIEVGVRPRYYKDGEDALLMDLNLESSDGDDADEG